MADERAIAAVVCEHFVMWRDRDVDGPPGEWFCECGQTFGFSHNAIDHVAAAIAALPDDDAARAAVAEVRTAVDEVIAAVEATYPPYNYELRYDGSEDPLAAAYVDAFREVAGALDPFRAAHAADGAEAGR